MKGTEKKSSKKGSMKKETKPITNTQPKTATATVKKAKKTK